MVIVLHPEQAAEVRLLAADLGLEASEVVRHLLSGPLAGVAGPLRVAV